MFENLVDFNEIDDFLAWLKLDGLRTNASDNFQIGVRTGDLWLQSLASSFLVPRPVKRNVIRSIL